MPPMNDSPEGRIVHCRGEELKKGIGIKTWFGTHTIIEIVEYNGPFDFIVSVARLSNGSSISIAENSIFEITA